MNKYEKNNMKNLKFSKEEKEILYAIEKDELVSVSINKQ